MKVKSFLLAACFVALAAAARKPLRVLSTQTEALPVDSTWDNKDNRTLAFIKPYKLALKDEMGIVLGTATETLENDDPHGRLTLWMAQAQADKARQVLNRQIDLGVMNIGGVRCDLPKGDITMEKMYELMPFDNELVVVLLPGSALKELLESFRQQGGQGDCWQHGLTPDLVQDNETYAIATSDYLAGGNDHMEALKKGKVLKTGLLLRDVYINAVKEQKKL